MPRTDPKEFWNRRILAWEHSRYEAPGQAGGLVERIAGRVSTSLRFRIEAAVGLLAPHVAGRRLVELGCGSGLLAERLMTLGAAGYDGFDIAETAIARARERHPGARPGSGMAFHVADVAGLPDQGDALVFSLGLFDWLSAAEIAHVLNLSRDGSYFHAVAERRRSPQQMIHRAYTAWTYGRESGYLPQYHSTAQIRDLLAAIGRPPPRIYRHPRMRFGIFISDLPLA